MSFMDDCVEVLGSVPELIVNGKQVYCKPWIFDPDCESWAAGWQIRFLAAATWPEPLREQARREYREAVERGLQYGSLKLSRPLRRDYSRTT